MVGKEGNWEKNHWKISNVLTRSKEVGGLGFQELHSFNMALLTKMDVRVLEEPTSLSVKVLKGIYFPRGDFLSSTKGGRASWGWSSLLTGRDILKRERIWRIGNGASINNFKDPWIYTKIGFREA